VNRFDEDTRDSFVDLYTKIDAGEDVLGEGEASDDNVVELTEATGISN